MPGRRVNSKDLEVVDLDLSAGEVIHIDQAEAQIDGFINPTFIALQGCERTGVVCGDVLEFWSGTGLTVWRMP